jgi:hypothetical protein
VCRVVAVDVLELERRADLLENDVDDEAGVAREVVKLQHPARSSDGEGAILAARDRGEPRYSARSR